MVRRSRQISTVSRNICGTSMRVPEEGTLPDGCLVCARLCPHKLSLFPRRLPGVFFFYEVSPLHVEITETYRKGWVAFFTSVCAVIGGVVSVMGMVRILVSVLFVAHGICGALSSNTLNRLLGGSILIYPKTDTRTCQMNWKWVKGMVTYRSLQLLVYSVHYEDHRPYCLDRGGQISSSSALVTNHLSLFCSRQ